MNTLPSRYKRFQFNLTVSLHYLDSEMAVTLQCRQMQNYAYWWKKTRRHAPYNISGIALEETIEVKDLGIWINNSLKPSVHVSHIVCKANQLLGLIRRSFTYLDCDLM